MMISRGFTQVLLALLLLVAQQQALAHRLEHRVGEQPAQSGEHGGKQHQALAACDFHGVYAQVLGGVNAAAPPAAVGHDNVRPRGGVCVVAGLSDRIVPASRGPPALH